jgi:hypothetical protein
MDPLHAAFMPTVSLLIVHQEVPSALAVFSNLSVGLLILLIQLARLTFGS